MAIRFSPEPSQEIDGQLVDPGRLLEMLRNVFGQPDDGQSMFRVEVTGHNYPSFFTS
jgi:hypothetical protein